MSNPSWHTNVDYDLPLTGSTIRTVSGGYIELLNPDPKDVKLGDIAHSLSLINRYGGHTATHYSVAEHSLGVSNMMLRSTGDSRAALFGLLHDASEAYLGDVVRPLKHNLQDYLHAENKMENAIFIALIGDSQLEDEKRWEMVKEADRAILAFEMSTIRNATWRIPPKATNLCNAFMSQYYRLTDGKNSLFQL